MLLSVLLVTASFAAVAPAVSAVAVAAGASRELAPSTSPEAEEDDARSLAKQQVEFGIKVAQSGLWKEAAYRWQKAVDLDPTYAAAWNNLAIAFEQQGNFDKAREAYDRAVTIDPDNALFRQNYDLFKEINDRTQRRRDR